MTDQELQALADEIEATIDAKVAQTTGTMQARIADLGRVVGEQAGEIQALKAENQALRERIEQVAKEPRVEIKPEFIVPTPAVHFAPTVQAAPPRPPADRVVKKQEDGSFRITDAGSQAGQEVR